MREIARLSERERSDLFMDVASSRHLLPAVIEKDFWVCFALDHLFHATPFSNSLVFKGGTSLSKAFGIIDRFSEDIDLIVDWRILGYGIDEPWQGRSNTAQERFKLEALNRTEEWLAHTFAPSLKASLSEALGQEAIIGVGTIEQTVTFEYPRLFFSSATLNEIRLEIGPLAAWSPSQNAEITSYAAEEYPQLFTVPSTIVRTAIPERTFWEKATILHQEANRPAGKTMPKRYSRHYYDMFMFARSVYLESALANSNLLADVVAFKQKFYRTPWSKLEDAKPGSLRLAPSQNRVAELQRDYEAMRLMLFGNRPSLDEIVEEMNALEERINKQSAK